MTFPFNLRESNPGPALTNQLPTPQESNSEPRLPRLFELDIRPRLFELDIRDSTPGQKPQPPSNSLQEPTPPKFTPLSHQEESNFGSDVRLIPRGRLNPDAAAGGVKPSHQDTLNLDDNAGGFDPSHQERLKSDAAAGRFNPSRQDRLNSRFNPRTRFNQESHQDSHQRNQRPNQITKNEVKLFFSYIYCDWNWREGEIIKKSIRIKKNYLMERKIIRSFLCLDTRLISKSVDSML